jgi:hypothetical protein
MSQPASFIPPNVNPPDPPGMKRMAIIFSGTMTLLMLTLIGVVCIDFIADITNYPMPYDAAQENAIQAACGPFISDFLGLKFQGQYAPKFGKNARFDSYHLTEEDRTIALQQFQFMLHNSEQVSVEVVSLDDEQQTISELFWLSYNTELADKLSTQIELAEDTFISPLDFKYVPDVVFTFHPSEVRINLMSNPPVPTAQFPFLFISLGQGMQRWEGFFGNGFTEVLMNTELLNGETVHSCVSERLPAFP